MKNFWTSLLGSLAAMVIFAAGVLVVVTHQVKITGISGLHTNSGAGVALRSAGSTLKVITRLAPPPIHR